ncbi:MAG TPA: GNAT family N-acetyltransferase [Burkholderiales bacterium]|nr:GNAT family N-acetyltransferase [Burkholderiales bacterium]
MIRVRPGELADLPALEQIERETAPMFDPADLPAALADPLPAALVAAGVSASLLWVAEDEASSRPAGFILCERPVPACLHIREMDVRPSFGRRGIGAMLLLHVCAVARRLGLRFVTLTTFSHLPWNAPFYARHGFRTPEEWTPFPHLPAILRHESELGLRNRVAMVRDPA